MLENLDKFQLEAVLAPQAPLAVMAGAGAGKTKVITSRILNQIDSGIDPSTLFVSAFTRAAANEMSERISTSKHVNRLNISTFHSLMFKFINSFLEANGSQAFDVCKESKKKIFFQKILDKPSRDFPDAVNIECDISTIISIISRWKNSAIHYYDDEIKTTLDDAPRNSDLYAAAKVYALYEKYLESNNLLDFDDMRLKALDLLSSNNDAIPYAKSMWSGFFVDEAQDTNIVQWSILEKIADPNSEPNITVVGDLRQCLFTFRGATPEVFEQFVDRYKGATVIDLINNYRCSAKIVDSANRLAGTMNVVDQVSQRSVGVDPQVFKFEDYEHQAQAVAEDILQLRSEGVSGGDIAVLVRTNSQSLPIETAFVSNGIPYWCNGGGFFDRMEVGDIVAYLKIANEENRFDLLRKVINRPTRYLGSAFVDAVEIANQKYGDLIKSIRLTNSYSGKKLSPKQRESAIALSNLLIAIREPDDVNISPYIAIGNILSKTEYVDWLKKSSGLSDDDNSSRLDNLEILKENAAKFTSVRDFLSFVDECSRLQVQSNDSTEISTIHRSKGSEWEHVWLTGMHEDSIPHVLAKAENDIIGERRIAYVGYTRAKNYLKIGVPSLDQNGNEVNPSRFIYDSGLSI
jgi:DNA helicase-2/ATP-dependent DNA helicase PcrA